MSKFVLDYAYGQAKLSIEASRHCVFSIISGDFTEHYRFKKGFYGLSDVPTVFQEHIDKVLEFRTPNWLDDIICVTNGTLEELEQELREVLLKFQDVGSLQCIGKLFCCLSWNPGHENSAACPWNACLWNPGLMT